MSIEKNHFNPVIHTWTPDTYQEDGIRYIVEEQFSYPENQLYQVEGLASKAKLRSQDKYIDNGQLVWFDSNQNMYVASITTLTNQYKDLHGKPDLKEMAFSKDAPDGNRYVRIQGKWIKAPEPKFQIWEPDSIAGDHAPYFNTYVLKEDEGITGKLSMSGNRLSVEQYNTGHSDGITQYVLGRQSFDKTSPIGLYFKFPNVPTEFNHIKLAAGFYRTASAEQASPLQQERMFSIDGIVMANEIEIDGLAGIPLQDQVRVNFQGSLYNLEFCLAYFPTTKELKLFHSQDTVEIASVVLDEFYIDSVIMGLDADIPRYNREIDFAIEMLSTPNTIHAGIPPFIPSSDPIPYITQDQYPDDRNGKGYEIQGLDGETYLSELGKLVSNGDLIWFDSTGTPRLFHTSNFSGKYKDLEGLPNLADVALSGSYLDLFDLPHLGTASEKDIEFFTTKEEFTERTDELDQEISSHKENSNNPHNVTKDQVGLGNVDNTSDINKPVSSEQALAIANAKAEAIEAANLHSDTHKVDKADLHMPNGVAILDSNGKLVVDQLPELSISRVHVVNSEAEQLALEVETGDVAVRLDEGNKAYMLRSGAQNVSMNDWVNLNQFIAIPTDAPMDGNLYGRRNGVWETITAIGGREFN